MTDRHDKLLERDWSVVWEHLPEAPPLVAGKYRVVVTGDFHGADPPPIPECDLLVYAGDVGGGRHYRDEVFASWLRTVPAGEIVGVAGNHDDNHAPLRLLPWTFLEDQTVVIDGFVVHGAPWRMPGVDLIDRWPLIPDDTDVLVVHRPPHGYGDQARPWGRSTGWERTGCEALTVRLRQLPELKLVACGHIHEAYGTYPFPGGSLVANGSYVNQVFQPQNPPIVVDVTRTGSRLLSS